MAAAVAASLRAAVRAGKGVLVLKGGFLRVQGQQVFFSLTDAFVRFI